MFHFNLENVSMKMLQHLQEACKEQIRRNQEQLNQVNIEITRRNMQQRKLDL